MNHRGERSSTADCIVPCKSYSVITVVSSTSPPNSESFERKISSERHRLHETQKISFTIRDVKYFRVRLVVVSSFFFLFPPSVAHKTLLCRFAFTHTSRFGVSELGRCFINFSIESHHRAQGTHNQEFSIFQLIGVSFLDIRAVPLCLTYQNRSRQLTEWASSLSHCKRGRSRLYVCVRSVIHRTVSFLFTFSPI
jgi:hypothetical protein